MNEVLNEISGLQYQIQRYQAKKNGTMCQLLYAKLQKLMALKAVA